VTLSNVPNDFTGKLFTEGEVNWESLNRLVAYAPAAVGVADGQVTSIDIQRLGNRGQQPIQITVYVEGPSGTGSLLANGNGDVTGTGPGPG
jgi:hypothetical protein